MMIVTLLVGIALIVFGRKVFWFFVGAVGFVAGMNLARNLLPDRPESVILVIALIAGVAAAVLAIVLKKIAIALAGFAAGAFLALTLMHMLGFEVQPLPWIPMLVGGIIGVILMNLIFDWALSLLSSLIGAVLIVQTLGVTGPGEYVLIAVLVVVGVLTQSGALRKKSPEKKSES